MRTFLRRFLVQLAYRLSAWVRGRRLLHPIETRVARAEGDMAMASVLIIEDEDRLRRILTLNLARRGYTVAEADSVEAAIEALETYPQPFDLLLLDINL